MKVRDATNAVIAEVEAMSRTAIRASEQREPQAETFLWVRVARLGAAAEPDGFGTKVPTASDPLS